MVLSLISIAASTSALAFFSETNFYYANFAPFGTLFLCFLSSTVIALHFILFFFHQHLKNAKILHGGFRQYIAKPVVFFATLDLYFIPDKSPAGLLFVISLWIDVNVILQIIRPSSKSYVPNLILTAISSRAIELYGWNNGTCWLIMFFCFVVVYVGSMYEDNVAYSEYLARQTKKVTKSLTMVCES